jgi:uncharacterized protein (DUF58 family)
MLSREALARVRRIEIGTRRKVGSLLSGNYNSVFRGQGMTFSEVRQYQPGDDVRRIDWNVTARSREVFVKQFVEERELTIALMIDVSASQRFGSRQGDKLRLAAELAALFAFTAIKHNDRVAMIAFSDDIEEFVPPKKGRKHVLRLVNDILKVRPVGKGTNWTAALSMAERVLKRRSVVLFISDFVGLPDLTRLKVFGRRHDVIPVWLTDPMEERLPDVGFLWVRDPETGEERMLDTGSKHVRDAYARTVRGEQLRVNDIFRRSGMSPIRITNGQDYARPLLQYFRARAKQQ